MPTKQTRTSNTYQFAGYSSDETLVEQFEEYATDFDSESQAVIYAIRSQLQRDMVDDE